MAGLPLPVNNRDAPPSEHGWYLERRVLPQHTDHAGVMWHGTYLGWLEEARVEALAAVGLPYSALSERGLALPVVSLAIDYRQALLHGQLVGLWSELLPPRGLKLHWRSRFLGPGGELAAQARVDLVLVDLGAGPGQGRVLRHPPEDLERAIVDLVAGPTACP
jgi:acyl-CoA thioester hydrolase